MRKDRDSLGGIPPENHVLRVFLELWDKGLLRGLACFSNILVHILTGPLFDAPKKKSRKQALFEAFGRELTTPCETIGYFENLVPVLRAFTRTRPVYQKLRAFPDFPIIGWVVEADGKRHGPSMNLAPGFWMQVCTETHEGWKGKSIHNLKGPKEVSNHAILHAQNCT